MPARGVRELSSFLEGAAGRAALLVVCAELLQSVSRGDHPELTPKLRALVDERLQDVRWTSALAQPTAAPLLHSVAQFDPLGSALARPRVRVLRTQCDGVATTVTAA